MTICDRCKTSDKWPGAFGVEFRSVGFHHGVTDKGPNRWNFDLCKDCAKEIKQKVDELVHKFKAGL